MLQDVGGNKLPVFVHPDGKELPFDADQTLGVITRLNGESKGHRERAEAAETKLKGFEGIEDPDAARKAIQTVKDLDAGQLVAAGKVEEMRAALKKTADEEKAAAIKSLNGKVSDLEKANGELTRDFHGEKMSNAFATSAYIAAKLDSPIDMLQALFGPKFKIEDKKIVGYDAAGNKIPSRKNPGDFAAFDEALEVMVGEYPHRDRILKSSGANGGGASGGRGSGNFNDLSKLSPIERINAARAQT